MSDHYGYLFSHDGRTYDPAGRTAIQPTDVQQRNLETERKEIEWLQSAPDKVFLYVKHPPEVMRQKAETAIGMNAKADYDHAWKITTWLGTSVATYVFVGDRVAVGGIAGRYAYKRSVDCRIYGVRYVGWYYESSGSYCRLRKSKRQPKA